MDEQLNSKLEVVPKHDSPSWDTTGVLKYLCKVYIYGIRDTLYSNIAMGLS